MSTLTKTIARNPNAPAHGYAAALKSDPDHPVNAPSSRQANASRARRESGRRRGVDPTTCERDYSADEVEFMNAIQAYKASSGRMFPTWSEVLEVLQGLGYEKLPASDSI